MSPRCIGDLVSIRVAVMASRLPDDIMLPPSAAPASAPAARSRLVAFVPITIAVVGVAAIMLGHVTASRYRR